MECDRCYAGLSRWNWFVRPSCDDPHTSAGLLHVLDRPSAVFAKCGYSRYPPGSFDKANIETCLKVSVGRDLVEYTRPSRGLILLWIFQMHPSKRRVSSRGQAPPLETNLGVLLVRQHLWITSSKY